MVNSPASQGAEAMASNACQVGMSSMAGFLGKASHRLWDEGGLTRNMTRHTLAVPKTRRTNSNLSDLPPHLRGWPEQVMGELIYSKATFGNRDQGIISYINKLSSSPLRLLAKIGSWSSSVVVGGLLAETGLT